MRLAITAAFLTCLPLLGQPPGEPKVKPIRVGAILDTIPQGLLAPSGVWSQDDLVEVERHLKKAGPGHKMLLLVQIANVEANDKAVSLYGPMLMQDYTKLAFRGNDLIVRPFIQNQDFIALPLADKAILQKAQRGQVAKLLVTTARVALNKTNVDVYFDGTLGKSTLLAVMVPPGTEIKP